MIHVSYSTKVQLLWRLTSSFGSTVSEGHRACVDITNPETPRYRESETFLLYTWKFFS